MSKATLIEEIAQRTGIKKKDVDAVLDTLGEVAKAAIQSEGEFTLTGIGKVSTRQTKARIGRNPRTGEDVNIPAKVAISFKPAKALKDAANG